MTLIETPPIQSAGLRPDGRKIYGGRQVTLNVGEANGCGIHDNDN